MKNFMIYTSHQILFGDQIKKIGGSCRNYERGMEGGKEGGRDVYGVLVRKPETKRPLGRRCQI
jgi:hypothetical protein